MSFPKDSTFSYYQIISKLGEGGMGEVFLAEDARLDRKVALKILPEKFAADSDPLNRFKQEAKAASALNHPNIITVYEIGESDGTNFIATEYIDGLTLRELISRKPSASLPDLLHISIQVAEALSAAHRSGIVHRDIKPENIMIRTDGYVKVLDFGLAKLTEPKPTGEENRTLVHSTPGIIRGTVSYMSPEQARGLKVDLRTDIWSFGVLLYEMLARRTPFPGETVTDQMLSIIQKEPADLRNSAPDLPDELYFIVSKTLRKKADERYQNIGDVLNDLRRVKQRLDYEEIERTLSPEDSQTRIRSQEHQTAIFDSQPSSDYSVEAVSFSTSMPSGEKLSPNNLSAELSPMIGREAELEEIQNLLKQPDNHLLTVTGVGGTGKTRLAQAVAHDSLNDFTDGVYFINLSAIESYELVVPIIAQTLGVSEDSGKPIKEKLKEFLSERKILLVLDNFEQLTEAAPSVGEFLSSAANLKILVTSRVRLHLRFEREFVLQPLAVPTDKHLDPNELGEYPAIRLFVESARAAKSNFELTEENASAVAEICRRLDGLPLAIELAAARVKMLAPQAILSRLSNSLKLLTGGARDLPKRQQTMRGAIAWSYDLLDSEEKILLNRLAVFAGGFSLDAAEEVANADSDLEVELFDGIASLVDKSLITQREMADGEPRFSMLAVVREFAVEQLEAGGEAEEVRRLHAEVFACMSEKAEPEIKAGKSAEWLDTIEREHDNLRAALEWSLEREPETALRIVSSSFTFWNIRGYFAEGGEWLWAALERSGEEANRKLRAKAYYGLGSLSWKQGDLDAAGRFSQESLRLARETDDKQLICFPLGILGIVKAEQGDLNEAKALTEESLELARELDDKLIISSRLNNLGDIAREQEDCKSARKYYKEAVELARVVTATPNIALYTLNLAMTACIEEDYTSAGSYALESLAINVEMKNKIYVGLTLGIFAAIAAAGGQTEKAARLFGTARVICEEVGYKIDSVDKIFFDRYTAQVRAALGEEGFEAAFTEGGRMRLKNAIALAREVD